MILIPIAVFVGLLVYHFLFLRIYNILNNIALRFDSPRKKRIFQIIILGSLLVTLIIAYQYFEKSANLGAGGIGFGNIVVQCFYKSFQSQENYRKSGKNWPSLSDILGKESGFFSKDFPTDKASQHDYIPLYHNYFYPYKRKDVNLLEIGVKKGGSLKMWREYFTSKSHIFGLDIDPASPHFPLDANMKTVILDSTNPEIKSMFEDSFFDIIIDDGAHTMWAQFYTFQNLFPKLKPDGIYVIEDIQKKDEFDHVFETGKDLEIKLLPDKSGEFIAFIKRRK